MILFNLIVAPDIAKLSESLTVNCYSMSRFFGSRDRVPKSLTLAYLVKNPEVLNEPKLAIAKKKFVKKKSWHKILNAVWHQVVFLSIPSRTFDKYIVELNYLNIHNDQDSKKSLLSKFSKSLIEGSIEASLSNASSFSFPLFSSIQYTWGKELKSKKEKASTLLQTNTYQDYLRQARNYLHQKPSFSHFPLFTVSNNLGQMILSEPPSELEKSKGLLGYVSGAIGRQSYQGWFFTSFEDAQEYMDSITEYYGLKQGHLKIFVCNFSTFYQILCRFGSQVYFRLVPDLAEVSDLIKNYRYCKNVSFHKKQKYGSTYFQGQPLYMLKAKNRHSYFDIDDKRTSRQYELMFTNYETACSVLNKIQSASLSSKRNSVPNLIVYNLEDFIKDQLSLKESSRASFLLVPSQNSYWFTKKHLLRRKAHLFYDTFTNYASFMRLWSKRVLWSLTSRQPYD